MSQVAGCSLATKGVTITEIGCTKAQFEAVHTGSVLDTCTGIAAQTLESDFKRFGRL